MERKAKDDKPYSSLHWIPGERKLKNDLKGDLSKPRKVSYKTKWTHAQNTVYWIHLARTQERELQLWQTRSHAIFVHHSVPPDRIERVMPENGEKTLYQRLETKASSKNNFS